MSTVDRRPNWAPAVGARRGIRNRALGLALVLMGVLAVGAGEPVRVGQRWDQLEIDGRVFHRAELTSLSARSIVLRHEGGLTSLVLRTLSPQWQARFGYDAAAALHAETAADAARQSTVRARAETPRRSRAASVPSLETLLQQFGTIPQWRTGVDLRPKLNELQLSVKDQGRRPSCSVFAVVSALEYQNALLLGRAEKLSEDYLIWATSQVTRRATPVAMASAAEESDAGFGLAEVVAAVRAYGIPSQSAMPNTFGTAIAAIAPPPPEVVEDARYRRRVYVHSLPGRDAATAIANIVHALNAGVPVVIGVGWPHERTIRAGVLTDQPAVAGYAHAVTIVGYTVAEGGPETARFFFKNSYGVRWGQAGYGQMSYRYLSQNLLGGILLEVQPGLN